MTSSIILKRNIAKLEAAIKSKATPKSLKSKLESQLVKSKAELSAINKGTKPKTSSTKSTQTTLEKLKAMINKKKFSVYQGKGIDLKKDADQGALAVGRRVSKGIKGNQFGDAKSSKGNVYYEYRANRLDVKQPKKAQKYPKLEDGGYMARGGKIPSNVEEFAKRKGISSMVSKIAGWAEKAGKKITGGTAIGKNYDTLILDLSYQDNAIYIDIEDGTITIYDEVVNNFNSFKNAIEKHKMANGGKVKEKAFRVILQNPNGKMNKRAVLLAKTKEDASKKALNLKEFKQYGYVVISANEIKYAHGGKTQGYDDKEDERLGMEYGKMSSKDLNSTHARRDDARFEERMAKGGEVRFVDEFTTEDGIEVSTAKTDDGKTLYGAQVTMYPLQKIIPFTSEDKNAVVERAKEIQSEMIEYLSKNEHRSDKLNQRFYAKGGVTDKEVVESNAEMVLSKIKEVHHHADELGDIVSKKSDIEAWVVAKIERASTDLSDITHYLDGQHQKMAMGGEIHRTKQ